MSRKMNVLRLSLLAAAVCLPTGFVVAIYSLTPSAQIRVLCLCFCGLMLLLIVAFYLLFRSRFTGFSEQVVDRVEMMINGEYANERVSEAETLYSKIGMKLDKLGDVTGALVSRGDREKNEIEQMVSDISHQMRTPIANLAMYGDNLLEQDLSVEETRRFIGVMRQQVDKLEFLTGALVKMSRLEGHLITLQKLDASLFDTLAQAVGGVSALAEKKGIRFTVTCDETLHVPHDPKWTAEALFNMLDNAVKYTRSGGSVDVTVERWEATTKIDIRDNGIGIAAEHINDVFKRFYRETKVSTVEGIGVGLYLSRQIISQQGGYIKVQSEEGKGSCFSVFLRNS